MRLALTLALLCLLAPPSCSSVGSVGDGAEPVPTVQVVREKFVRKVGAEGNLRPVDATELLTPPEAQESMKIAWLLEDGQHVEEGDLVVRFDDTAAKQEHLNASSDLQVASKKLERERLNARRSNRDRKRAAELATLEMQTTRQFQSRDEQIYSRNEIARSKIDSELARARLEHANKSRVIEERLAASKLALLELSGQRAQLSIDRAQETLANLELRAPHAGVVVFKQGRRGDIPQVGDTAWPGQRLADLPQLDRMEAQVYVLEADAAGLEEGLPAVVVLDAHPGKSWPASISQVDKLAKPRQRRGNVQYFEVILDLETTDPTLMKPGQRVHARLELGGDEALVVPRQAIFERDGETVAWRRWGVEFVPVPLELGVSSPGRVTVLSGLEEGDEVAVRDPTRQSSAGGSGQGSGSGSVGGAN